MVAKVIDNSKLDGEKVYLVEDTDYDKNGGYGVYKTLESALAKRDALEAGPERYVEYFVSIEDVLP